MEWNSGHLYFCIYQKGVSVHVLSSDPFQLTNTDFLRAIIIFKNIFISCASQNSQVSFHHFSVEDLFKV